MPLISVVRDVCAVIGVAFPTSVFSNISSDRTRLELLALANEIAQRIAYDNREWTLLKKQASLTGDGIKTAFDLPANYKRMLLTSKVWRSSAPVSPMRFVPDTDEWINRRARNYSDTRGEWTLLGGQMHIFPTLGPSETAMFAYLDKNCIGLKAGGFGEEFVDDNDTYPLGERLLKLGMIWQWKAQKGSPYAEDMGSYSDALANMMGRDQPAPIIIDRRPISHTMRHSYPWPVPT